MTKFTEFERSTMLDLIRIANRQKGKTSPNPVTAAAIIKDEQVIALGIHQYAGGPHAEVIAIESVNEKEVVDLSDATLLVNLEPCTHEGRTPPCTDAIIRSGIKRVIYAMADPNPKVRSLPADDVLRAAGIDVVSGLCEEEANDLNEVFIKNQLKNQPFVIMKAGISLDGKIALESGESKYITSEESLKKVHELRREVDAILIGINTLFKDDPLLSVRFNLLQEGYTVPKRIVLDPEGQFPEKCRLLSQVDSEIVVVTSEVGKLSLDKKEMLNGKITPLVVPVSNNVFNWQELLNILYNHGVTSVLLEGGQGVFTTALEAEIVDKLVLFMAPKLLGGAGAPSFFAGQGVKNLESAFKLRNMGVELCGVDVMIQGYLNEE